MTCRNFRAVKQNLLFENMSYRGQVRVLTAMAREVIARYSLNAPKLEFINHGENATFRVKDRGKGDYLLRLHRPQYHSEAAISEELQWLVDLKGQLTCQRPIRGRNGKFLNWVGSEQRKHWRICDLLRWEPGEIRFEKHSVDSFFKLGRLTADLHHLAPSISKNRNYWTAEGLLGSSATFGSPLDMAGKINDYDTYNACRILTFKKLQKWQVHRKDRLGLIHADLHFGNILWNRDEIIPIDFDDCGYGFYMYDLAVTFISSENLLAANGGEEKAMAYLVGYQEVRDLDGKDLEMIPWMMLARKLGMISWLFHRQDNPRLVPIFERVVKKEMPFFRRCLTAGPHFDWLPL